MADTQETANPNPWSIKETEFMLVSEVEASLSPNHDRLLIRKLSGIDATYIDKAASDLRFRTSSKNPVGVACNTVEDPYVGDPSFPDGKVRGRVYEGRWRGVSVRTQTTNGKTGELIQTLAYGLVKRAEALPAPELVSRENSLFFPHALYQQSTKTQREVRYRGIDPEYVQDLQNTISLTAGIIDTKSVRMADGSYNIHALYEVVAWINSTPNFQIIRITADGSSKVKTTYKAVEVPIGLAEDFVVALGATEGITDVWWEDAGDGEARITYTTGPTEVEEEEVGRTIGQCGEYDTVTIQWNNVAATDVDETYNIARAYDFTDPEVGGEGWTLKSLSKSIAEDGTATITAVGWKNPLNGIIEEVQHWAQTKDQDERVRKTWFNVEDIVSDEIYATAKLFDGSEYEYANLVHSWAGREPDSTGCWTISAEATAETRADEQVISEEEGDCEQLDSQTYLWPDVAPGQIDEIWGRATEWKPDGDDWAHKSATKTIKSSGYADITATASKNPQSGVEEITEVWDAVGDQLARVRHTWYNVEDGAAGRQKWEDAKTYALGGYVHSYATREMSKTGCWTIVGECVQLTAREDQYTGELAATGEQNPAFEFTWYDIPPGDVPGAWNTATGWKYTGDARYVHKSASKTVRADGYATITATSWIPPSGALYESVDGLTEVSVRTINTGPGGTLYQLVTSTFSLRYFSAGGTYTGDPALDSTYNGLTAAWQYISGGLDGSNVSQVDTIRRSMYPVYRAKKVTSISFGAPTSSSTVSV